MPQATFPSALSGQQMYQLPIGKISHHPCLSDLLLRENVKYQLFPCGYIIQTHLQLSLHFFFPCEIVIISHETTDVG